MKHFPKYIILSFSVFILFGFVPNEYKSAPERLKRMFESTHGIETISYNFKKLERIDGEMIENLSEVRVQRHPYKFYLKEVYPNTGMEVLYPHPSNDSKALINPNGFPWMNLKLDPDGELMRNNQHHTVMEGGYDYVVSILEYYFYKYRNSLDERVVNSGTAMVHGRRCDVVTIQNDNFHRYEYAVKKGESIASIALKNRLNEYMIAQNNEDINIQSSLDEGQIIVLSSDYCAKMTIYLDQTRQVPLKMEIFDDKGIFERYEFLNIKINPLFATQEFEITNSAYDF